MNNHPLLLLALLQWTTPAIAFPWPIRLGSSATTRSPAAVAVVTSRTLSLLWMSSSSSSSAAAASSSSIDPTKLIRGDSYGIANNSTVPTATEVAQALGVRPPLDVSPRVWKRAYLTLQYATPVLHWFDRLRPPNSSLNLYCLWWKALAGNDDTSPVYDRGLSAALLPASSRWIVAYPRLYPRLHHANVELRTAYLDASVEYFATSQQQQHPTTPWSSSGRPHRRRRRRRIRLVSFGSGYDVRSVKLRLRGLIDEAVEFDLPDVVTSKAKLLSSPRFQHRLRVLGYKNENDDDDDEKNADNNGSSLLYPRLVPVDLNDVDAVRLALEDVMRPNKKMDHLRVDDDTDAAEYTYHTIFLFEAVMIYLNQGAPQALLRLCRSVLNDENNTADDDESSSSSSSSSSGSLCFADRLENVPGGDGAIGAIELEQSGWRVVDWQPKPGLARHMGRAVPIFDSGW